jgi:Dyp-type peroxidase family
LARILDLPDIQGNIVSPYGPSFPKARYFFLHVTDEAAGRAFVDAVQPKVTTGVRWQSKRPYPGAVIVEKPSVCMNIGLSFRGLVALGLPTTTLSDMPFEFIDGMLARWAILGDDVARMDSIWRNSDGGPAAHIVLALAAQMNPDGSPVNELETTTRWVFDRCEALGQKVRVLSGHGPDEALYQDASALLAREPDGTAKPLPIEHFGFTDGFSDAVFDGQYPADEEPVASVGGGKLHPNQTWGPLATGEFLLGYPDESQEQPPAARPHKLTRNGTFMVYRKLHENVVSFRTYIADLSQTYARISRIDAGDARELLLAKMAGRWSDGVPLMTAPTLDEWKAFRVRAAAVRARGDAAEVSALKRAYNDFQYRTDRDGSKCPVASHIRRVNPRDALDPLGGSPDKKRWGGSVLNNRRRILRRGLPYGQTSLEAPTDAGEHGILFIAFCASLFRQFEFIQQQWLHYGLDFGAGNDTCPIVGNHGPDSKFVIPGDAKTAPFICPRLPQFVEPRGGEYFLMPSLTAIRMIASGVTDPT